MGAIESISPEDVHSKIRQLLQSYKQIEHPNFDTLLDFHFIISDDLKVLYYRGLSEWKSEKGYLRDTCLTAQDKMKQYLDYFKIRYDRN